MRKIDVIHFNNTDSTQIRAKEILKFKSKNPPFCLVAAKQSGGYGQAGRRYYCPSGGLYMSLVIQGKDFPYKFATGFVAVCVARVVSRLVRDGRELSIKWINDINLDGKKVGGVLVEAVVTPAPYAEKYNIIGVGLNLNQTEEIPKELKDRMGFINTTVTVQDIANEIITEITESKISDEEVLAEYKKYCNQEGLCLDGSVETNSNGKIVKKISNI